MPGQPYPSIGDYAFISGMSSAALVSRTGSIDWCCMPRFDTGSCFGRLLDWQNGGQCSIQPASSDYTHSRSYIDGTLVLETRFWSNGGEVRLMDCFSLAGKQPGESHRLLRVLDGVRGEVELDVNIAPRFDYGAVSPWIRHHGVRLYSASGGNDALVISGDIDIRPDGKHTLVGRAKVRAGQRVRLSIQYVSPEDVDEITPPQADVERLDRELEETIEWWQSWSSRCKLQEPYGPGVKISALVLEGLRYSRTGAIAAAATTSISESLQGPRNYDYRYSWIRDSTFSVRSLADLGYEDEAERFRRFIGRSAAGSAQELRILYGVGGERRINQLELEYLEGYKGIKPVIVGNAASTQFQLGVYGELLDLAWRWHIRGKSPDDDYWRFLVDLVEATCDRWEEPDSGIWEMPDKPRHFVHSKTMAWAALHRGITLATECMRQAPIAKWEKIRKKIRQSIETNGYDEKRGVFVQSYGSREMDSALLLMPTVGFLDYNDERMVRTVDVIREELDSDGLLLRYSHGNDSLPGNEGTFLACSFWLAECLTHQGRLSEAREVYGQAVATANDLGLFSEEYDTDTSQMLGNFPQGLTHLSHIAAAVALASS